MKKPIFDSRGKEFKFVFEGKTTTFYTVYGKDEKHARKNLLELLEKLGKENTYKDISLQS